MRGSRAGGGGTSSVVAIVRWEKARALGVLCGDGEPSSRAAAALAVASALASANSPLFLGAAIAPPLVTLYSDDYQGPFYGDESFVLSPLPSELGEEEKAAAELSRWPAREARAEAEARAAVAAEEARRNEKGRAKKGGEGEGREGEGEDEQKVASVEAAAALSEEEEEEEAGHSPPSLSSHLPLPPPPPRLSPPSAAAPPSADAAALALRNVKGAAYFDSSAATGYSEMVRFCEAAGRHHHHHHQLQQRRQYTRFGFGDGTGSERSVDTVGSDSSAGSVTPSSNVTMVSSFRGAITPRRRGTFQQQQQQQQWARQQQQQKGERHQRLPSTSLALSSASSTGSLGQLSYDVGSEEIAIVMAAAASPTTPMASGSTSGTATANANANATATAATSGGARGRGWDAGAADGRSSPFSELKVPGKGNSPPSSQQQHSFQVRRLGSDGLAEEGAGMLVEEGAIATESAGAGVGVGEGGAGGERGSRGAYVPFNSISDVALPLTTAVELEHAQHLRFRSRVLPLPAEASLAAMEAEAAAAAEAGVALRDRAAQGHFASSSSSSSSSFSSSSFSSSPSSSSSSPSSSAALPAAREGGGMRTPRQKGNGGKGAAGRTFPAGRSAGRLSSRQKWERERERERVEAEIAATAVAAASRASMAAAAAASRRGDIYRRSLSLFQMCDADDAAAVRQAHLAAGATHILAAGPHAGFPANFPALEALLFPRAAEAVAARAAAKAQAAAAAAEAAVAAAAEARARLSLAEGARNATAGKERGTAASVSGNGNDNSAGDSVSAAVLREIEEAARAGSAATKAMAAAEGPAAAAAAAAEAAARSKARAPRHNGRTASEDSAARIGERLEELERLAMLSVGHSPGEVKVDEESEELYRFTCGEVRIS